MTRAAARRTAAGCLAATALVGLAATGASPWTSNPWLPPSLESVRREHRPSDARLLDRRGRLLHEVRLDPTRRVLAWTPVGEVSPALVEAVVESEDRRFFEHGGVDVAALGAAAWQRLRHGSRRGGSTITMQLAALLDPALGRPAGGRRTLSQKLRQLQDARALERAWTKHEILEAYLNLVPFRGEVEGVTAAAAVLLAKSPHGIDRAEATVLAALVPSPSASRARILSRAQRLGGTRMPARALASAAARIFDVPDRRGPTPSLAPHLARRAFAGASSARTMRSTVDADLQRRTVAILEQEIAAVRAHNVRDGAVVVLDNASGDVLAYVGSSGRLATSPHVDGVRARRQAGSTLKPFLYALALDRKLLTAASLLDDSPLEIPLEGAVYRPRNYDASFHGPVTLRTALASSLNVPAVRTQRLLGEPAFVAQLDGLGLTGLVTTGDHYGPSLALGSAEVSLLELANAYRTLARGGVWTPTRVRVDAPDGPEPRRVLSEAASFVIGDVLSDREARSATFGLENALATGFWSAVKTGTSKEMRDNWCVGFSREFTVGVWVGNASGEPMHEVSGITGAAPTWLRVMSHLHRERRSVAPAPPAGVVAHRVSLPDGKAGDEWFLAGTEPAGSEVQLAPPRPHIVTPVESAVVAIDPDIPSSRQQLAIAAVPPTSTFAFRMDGKRIGSASETILWAPRPGRHDLELLDSFGTVLDRVGFWVRGEEGLSVAAAASRSRVRGLVAETIGAAPGEGARREPGARRAAPKGSPGHA